MLRSLLKDSAILQYTNPLQISILLIFVLSLIVIFFSSISLGSFSFAFQELFNGGSESLDSIVLFEIRIPRVLLAAFVGASLGLSGASLQGLFRNPLADPGLILSLIHI